MQADQDSADAWKLLLGQRVRVLRRARGLTLRQLADASGLSLRFLSQVEAGHANPSLASLRELSQSLGVAVVQLVAEAEHPGKGRHGRAESSSLHHALHDLVDALSPHAAGEALRLLREAAL